MKVIDTYNAMCANGLRQQDMKLPCVLLLKVSCIP